MSATIAVLAFLWIFDRQPTPIPAKLAKAKSSELTGAAAGATAAVRPDVPTETQPAAAAASAQTAAQKSAPEKRPRTGIAERTGERRVPLHETMAATASGVFVSAAGKETAMEPDEIGVFPRQHIEPGREVTVRVSYPEARI